MAKYQGADCRLCRVEKNKLYFKGHKCLTDKCPLERRAYAPGQHGRSRKRVLGYAIQLREKQKLKRFYGMSEEQFHFFFERAERQKGVTGENLLTMLERRLDNVVTLMGFALSRGHARQLIGHGHFRMNDHKSDIASALVKPGDVIAFRPRSAKSEDIQAVVASNRSKNVPGWLEVDWENMKGRVLALPTRAGRHPSRRRTPGRRAVLQVSIGGHMTETNFQRPKYLECDYETLTGRYGRFSAQPFERGYGVTVGNALRRILLSSITGAAITSVRIHGVLHEFSTIPGVVEDVTDILLNLKSIPLKLQGDEPRRMTIKKTGPATVSASDIAADSDVEILDKDITVASLDIDGTLEVEMVVKNGRGYIPADQNFDEDQSLDYIPLDSSHSPVLKVNYKVEPARVGKRIDYEGLTLEIWTTGAIRPMDALSQAAKIMRDHLGIFLSVVDEPLEHDAAPTKKEIPFLGQADVMAKTIDHLELSVRSNNCLRSAGIERIYELVQKTEDELLKTKNFGRKSLAEIKETLANLNLGLNIELHPRLIERIQADIKTGTPEKETEA